MAYSPVYSAQFILYTDADPTLAYLVPEGYTAILREVTIQTNLGGVIGQVYIQNSESAPRVSVAQVDAVGAPGYDQWSGRVVVPGGGIINLELTSLDSGTSVYVGGYLLQNVID